MSSSTVVPRQTLFRTLRIAATPDGRRSNCPNAGTVTRAGRKRRLSAAMGSNDASDKLQCIAQPEQMATREAAESLV